ncbi:unnamed protein product [Symbiodinium microadriaticum]|nr:unnamed protein product [Symbiodinium microadriaticum]
MLASETFTVDESPDKNPWEQLPEGFKPFFKRTEGALVSLASGKHTIDVIPNADSTGIPPKPTCLQSVSAADPCKVLASSMETVESLVPPRSTGDSDHEDWEKISDDVAVARATLVHNLSAHEDEEANAALASFTALDVDDTSLDERLQEMNAAMARLLSKGDEKVVVKEEAAPTGDFVPEGGPSEDTTAVAIDTDPAETQAAPGDFVPEEDVGDHAMGGGYPSSSRPFSALPSGTLEEMVFHIEGFPENFPNIGKKSADLAKQLTKEEIAALFSKLKTEVWTRIDNKVQGKCKLCQKNVIAVDKGPPSAEIKLGTASWYMFCGPQGVTWHTDADEAQKENASVNIGAWAQPPPPWTDLQELSFADQVPMALRLSLAHTVASQPFDELAAAMEIKKKSAGPVEQRSGKLTEEEFSAQLNPQLDVITQMQEQTLEAVLGVPVGSAEFQIMRLKRIIELHMGEQRKKDKTSRELTGGMTDSTGGPCHNTQTLANRIVDLEEEGDAYRASAMVRGPAVPDMSALAQDHELDYLSVSPERYADVRVARAKMQVTPINPEGGGGELRRINPAQMAATLVEVVRHILRDTLHATSVRTELAEVGELPEAIVKFASTATEHLDHSQKQKPHAAAAEYAPNAEERGRQQRANYAAEAMELITEAMGLANDVGMPGVVDYLAAAATRGTPLPTPNAFEITALTLGVTEESNQYGEQPSMAELIELLELVHSYNWQVTHWATDAAEEALALLTVVTATDHAKELEEATSQVGDILPRRATQHPQRDPPDALHVYRAQRALRQLHPFLEGEMRRLGEQALNQLGAWMPSHWGEAVQLLSSDEEAPTGQQNHDEEGVHDGGDVLGTTMPDGTAGRPVLQTANKGPAKYKARASAAREHKDNTYTAFPRRRRGCCAYYDCLFLGLCIYTLAFCSRSTELYPNLLLVLNLHLNLYLDPYPHMILVSIWDGYYGCCELRGDVPDYSPVHCTANVAEQNSLQHENDAQHYLYVEAQQPSSPPPQHGDLHPDLTLEIHDEAKGNTPAGDDLADDLAEIAEGGNPDAELSEEDNEEGPNTVDDKGATIPRVMDQGPAKMDAEK